MQPGQQTFVVDLDAKHSQWLSCDIRQKVLGYNDEVFLPVCIAYDTVFLQCVADRIPVAVRYGIAFCFHGRQQGLFKSGNRVYDITGIRKIQVDSLDERIGYLHGRQILFQIIAVHDRRGSRRAFAVGKSDYIFIQLNMGAKRNRITEYGIDLLTGIFQHQMLAGNGSFL